MDFKVVARVKYWYLCFYVLFLVKIVWGWKNMQGFFW